MKKELLFSETKESKKEYLSRMAILLAIIRNFPDLKASHPLLMTMDDTDLKEFENYLCLVVYKDVERTTKMVAANNSLLDYKDVIFSYLIMDVISNLHKYNNPAYVGYAQGYSFDSFIRAYAKNAVRQAISEKTGLNKHQLAKANHVKKTIRLVALAKKISMDCVTIDDIFEYQGKVGDSLCLKKEVISEVLGYMNTPVHNDGMEEFDVQSMDSEYEESEKNETKELLRAFFDNLRSAQKYIFLQRCQSKEEGATVKQMAKNERLIALCLLDEVSKRNITVGNLSIMRPKGKTDAPQIEEVFENVQYVKLEFIDYMYRDAKKRLIGYIRDHGLRQQDLEGCLGDLLDEEWYKINM